MIASVALLVALTSVAPGRSEVAAEHTLLVLRRDAGGWRIVQDASL